MVYQRGLAFGAIMLATGLLSAWITVPLTDDGEFDTSPGIRTTLAFGSALVVSVIGAAIVVLSLLE